MIMFITVKYGDDKSEIFNPNCLNVILLHNIRERCDCDDEDLVELCDETGNVMHLLTNPTDYGKQYLTERSVFILLRVERDGDGDEEKYTYHPLLHGLERNKDFLARLNPKRNLPRTSHDSHKSKESRHSRNEDHIESSSPTLKDARRKGTAPSTQTGSSAKSKPQQTNSLKRGSSRSQMGRR
ncbi:uncharacterized protein CXorf65 homolog isoform X1 [Ptychodera flava]|uniref:uncharacterized protein CXorf65 homolog isoform X1 n=1 Tax=Ptychodera flava TaxID=63121 RepID=UPI00396A265E